ncbi:MAG: DNA primase [Candidatus Omnitrophica bacterium]|nr:DNA primase [Candidatus Omnitrophota bacterium]
MRYEDKIVEEVQRASDIVEIVSQVLPIKRTGRHFKGLCPFHQEKTPSFIVNAEKQIFHCFGCQAGGDIFSFLMRYENLSFPEALRRLAERAHIRLPEPSRRNPSEGPSEKEKLYEINQLAQDFYHARFCHPQEGKAAREYWQKRGFDEKLAAEFKIGWAPAEWRQLYDFLSKKGFPEALLLKSGLVHRSPKGPFYDAFRGRLLFPIHNLQGKAVAFGGRLIDNSEGPKYLNSPETPVFHKRQELFGLYLAKKFIDRNLPQIFIVEGYLDFLRLYEKGFHTTVATLGTALTPDHVQILKRFADEAVVIYDGDQAGEMASLRGLEVFLEGGMNVKVVRMPKGYDPDDFLKKESAEAFKKLIQEARDFFDYELEILSSRYDSSQSLGLVKITNEVLETFTKVKNPVLLDRYLKRLAGVLGVEELSLRTEFSKLQKKSTAASRTPGALPKSQPKTDFLFQDEVLLLSLMMEDIEIRDGALRELTESDFKDSKFSGLFKMLSSLHAQNSSLSWSQLLNRLEDEGMKERLIACISLEWTPEKKSKAFKDCLSRIKNRQLEKRLEELRRLVAKAEHEKDLAGVDRLASEYRDLLARIRQDKDRALDSPK